eukprot:TRINITY_DN38736_c0_g1_i1.p2 TRINITY_DN38736_c0_g1~~TRINITY_DN38736_c0_g1_i1.p2  ORF type:complete len:156 (+),score=12.14 TRINITY_DN38736_c0_g1_i1:75-542(+)
MKSSRFGQLSLTSRFVLIHGLVDAVLPNHLTSVPLATALDIRRRSTRERRGWAWFFLFCGFLKAQSVFADPRATARSAGWAYAAQAVVIAWEGFFHRSMDAPRKVLSGTAGFCAAMWVWLQVLAWRHSRKQILGAGTRSANHDENSAAGMHNSTS